VFGERSPQSLNGQIEGMSESQSCFHRGQYIGIATGKIKETGTRAPSKRIKAIAVSVSSLDTARVTLQSVDWGDILKTVLTTGTIVATGSFVSVNGYKLPIGRAAKHDNLLDHYTKEVALQDALLKLKISATEEKSAKQIAAVKEAAFKQAQELDTQYRQESYKLTAVRPEWLWWRTAPFRDKLFPPKYDRMKLDLAGKRKWWTWIGTYFLLMAIYGWLMYELVESFKAYNPGGTPQERSRALVQIFTLFLFGQYPMWAATGFRRGAYALARRSDVTPVSSLP
jgi:hypothetical protein